MKRIEVAIAIIRRGDKILICQRKSDANLGGYWEFPGGKVECDESLEQCVIRETREELNIQVLPGEQLGTIEHDYDQVQVRLHPFICDHVSGEPELLEVQAAKWIAPNELMEYQFPEANVGLIRELVNRLG
jgi:mutator protein MutT